MRINYYNDMTFQPVNSPQDDSIDYHNYELTYYAECISSINHSSLDDARHLVLEAIGLYNIEVHIAGQMILDQLREVA